MPFDQYTTDTQVEQTKKRQRQQAQDSQSSSSSTSYTQTGEDRTSAAVSQPDIWKQHIQQNEYNAQFGTYDPLSGKKAPLTQTQKAIKLIWRATNGKIPTHLIQGLSQADFSDEDLTRLSKFAARKLDLPASFVWNPGAKVSSMTDPLYGGDMRMDTIMRITEGLEPGVLVAMLPQLLDGSSATQVQRYLKAVMPVARDLNLTAFEGIAMAMGLAKAKIPRQQLAQNIRTISDWNTTGYRGLANETVVGLAAEAAKRKVPLTTGFDIISFIADYSQDAGLKEFVNKAKEEQARAAQQQAVANAPAPEGIRGSAYNTYVSTPVEMPNYEALAKVANNTVEGNLFTSLREVQDQLKWEESAWTRSFVGSKLVWVFDKWDAATRDVQKGFLEVAAPISGSIYAARALGGDVQGTEQGDLVGAWQIAMRFRDEHQQRLTEGEHLGSQMVDDLGLPSWTNIPANLFFDWASDPTIIAGKLVTGARVAYVLPGELAKPTLLRSAISKLPGVSESFALKDPQLVAGLVGDISFSIDNATVEAALKAGKSAAEAKALGIAQGRILAEAKAVRTGKAVIVNGPSRTFSGNLGGKVVGDRGLIYLRKGQELVDSGGFKALFEKGLMKTPEELRGQLKRWGTHFMPMKNTKLVWHERFMMNLQDELKTAVAGGMSKTEALAEAKQAALTHFALSVPQEGSITAKVWSRTMSEADDATKELITKSSAFNASETATQAVEDVTKAFESMAGRVPLGLELPHVKLLGAGVREGALATENEALNRAARVAFGPGERSQIVMHEPLGPQFEALARRGLLSEPRAQQFAAEAAALGGPGFEKATKDLAQKLFGEVIDDRLIRKGITGEQAVAIKKQIVGIMERVDQRLGKNNAYVFGVDQPTAVRGAADFPRPMLVDTQLTNFFYHADPADIARLTDRAIGHTGDALKQMQKMGLASADTTVAEFLKFEGGKELLRSGLRTWKFLAVPRPAYTVRVILLDENLRFLTTTGSMFERAAAVNFTQAGQAFARVLTPTPYVPIVGKYVTEGAGKLGTFVGWATDKSFGKALDWLYPSDLYKVGDNVGVFRRPGLEPYNPLANSTWRESEMTDDIVRKSLDNSRLTEAVRGQLKVGDKGFYEEWAHDLTNQFGQSSLGKELLTSIEKGEGRQGTYLRAKAWAYKNIDQMEAAGWTKYEIADWADKMSAMTHAYTAGRPEIAAFARDIRDVPGMVDALKALPEDVTRPVVHGQMVESFLGTKVNALQRYTDYWYDVFVRMPENVLNRQPYYSSWKSQTSRAMTEWATRPSSTTKTISYDEALRGSKVADESGSPIRVYHGTGTEFQAFDESVANPTALYGPGLYHTDNPRIAGGELTQEGAVKPGYAGTRHLTELPPGDAPQVRFSYLDIKNPFDVDARFSRADTEALIRRASQDAGTGIPRTGSLIDTPEGEFRIKHFDDANGSVTAVDEDGRIREFAQQDYRLLGGSDIADNVLGNMFLIGPEGMGGSTLYTYLDDILGNKIEVNRFLQAEGYDGIHHTGGFITHQAEKHNVWIAFKPEQVLHGVPDVRIAKTVPADARAAIDAASRDVALAQVKKIMFDFAETGKWAQHLSMVFPFLQPFAEAFTVWGHILVHRNPALAGEVKALWNAGKESGFISKDPQSGEYVIPTSWWASNTIGTEIVANALNKYAFGLPPEATLHVMKAVSPVQALNLFFSSTMTLPRDGFLGAVAGGAEVPVPSTAPWVTFALQKAFKNSDNEIITSYLFKYGYTTPFLPAGPEKVLRGVFPEWFNEDINHSVETQVLRQLDARGVLDQWKAEGKTPEEITTMIQQMARSTTIAYGLSSLYQFGQTKRTGEEGVLQQELADLRKQYGYESGTARYLAQHPDDPLIAVGSGRFGIENIDLTTGKPILDSNGQPVTDAISMPYSPIVTALLTQPGWERVRDHYPEMMGALLLTLDPEIAAKYDPAALSQMYMRGWYSPQTLEEMLAQGETAGPKGFWSTIERLKTQYPYQDYETTDRRYSRTKGDFQEALLPLLQQYPFYAYRYLEPDPGSSDGPNAEPTQARFKYSGGNIPPYAQVAKLRMFANLPELQQFPTVISLNYYLEQRDKFYEEMSAKGISSLSTTAAQEAGFVKRMDSLRAAMPASTLKLIDTFTPNDLYFDGAVQNKAEREVAKLKEASDLALAENPGRAGAVVLDKYKTYTDFLDKLYKLYNGQTEPKYDQATKLMDEMYKTDPWAVKLWWGEKTYAERAQYQEGLVTRYPLYYSRFDWELMGVKVNAQSQDYLKQIADARAMIGKLDDEYAAKGKDFSSGTYYGYLDDWVKLQAKTNKNFAQAVNQMNTWGWQFDAAGLPQRPGREGAAWRNVITTAREFQSFIDKANSDGTDKNDLHGFKASYGDQLQTYAQFYQRLEATVNQWRDDNHAFDQAWSDLDQNYNGNLLELLMPHDYYFRLGGVPKLGASK